MQILFDQSISPALCNMGNQYHGYFVQGTRKVQILIHRNRHIHQVDESYASGKHNIRSNSQVPTEHHIQILRTSKSLDR
jgi:hypothetical protein